MFLSCLMLCKWKQINRLSMLNSFQPTPNLLLCTLRWDHSSPLWDPAEDLTIVFDHLFTLQKNAETQGLCWDIKILHLPKKVILVIFLVWDLKLLINLVFNWAQRRNIFNIFTPASVSSFASILIQHGPSFGALCSQSLCSSTRPNFINDCGRRPWHKHNYSWCIDPHNQHLGSVPTAIVPMRRYTKQIFKQKKNDGSYQSTCIYLSRLGPLPPSGRRT